jgi:hypothetical protein
MISHLVECNILDIDIRRRKRGFTTPESTIVIEGGGIRLLKKVKNSYLNVGYILILPIPRRGIFFD